MRGTASFDVFCVKISVGASAVASLKNQKKRNNSRTRGVIFHAYGEKNPWSDLVKILHLGRYPGRNHRCKFVGRSVKPFFRGEGSNFRLFHRLSQSSLQHSRTTVRVCDEDIVGCILYNVNAFIFIFIYLLLVCSMYFVYDIIINK